MEDLKTQGRENEDLVEVKSPDGASYYVKKESLQSVSSQKAAPVKAKADDNLIRGITPNGFEFTLDKRKINDMAFIEALREVENDNPVYIVELFNQILGEDQKQRLYDFCREEDGIVPIEKCADEFAMILKSAGDDVKKF